MLPTHRKGPRTWLFRDLWNLDNLQGMDLRQGVARWRPEGTFEVPMAGSLSTWPLVYRDKSSGRWRMLYTTKWLPYTLKVAAGDDGIRWQPEPHPEIQPPEGEKLAPQPLADLGECGPLQAGEAQPGGKVRSRDPVFSRARYSSCSSRACLVSCIVNIHHRASGAEAPSVTKMRLSPFWG